MSWVGTWGIRVVALVVFVLAAGCGVASGQFNAAATAASGIATLRLEPPASASTSTSDGCASIVVSWTAAAGADSYRVQVQSNGGEWLDLDADTGDVRQVTDATGHVASSVSYRIFARDVASGWESSISIVTAVRPC